MPSLLSLPLSLRRRRGRVRAQGTGDGAVRSVGLPEDIIRIIAEYIHDPYAEQCPAYLPGVDRAWRAATLALWWRDLDLHFHQPKWPNLLLRSYRHDIWWLRHVFAGQHGQHLPLLVGSIRFVFPRSPAPTSPSVQPLTAIRWAERNFARELCALIERMPGLQCLAIELSGEVAVDVAVLEVLARSPAFPRLLLSSFSAVYHHSKLQKAFASIASSMVAKPSLILHGVDHGPPSSQLPFSPTLGNHFWPVPTLERLTLHGFGLPAGLVVGPLVLQYLCMSSVHVTLEDLLPLLCSAAPTLRCLLLWTLLGAPDVQHDRPPCPLPNLRRLAVHFTDAGEHPNTLSRGLHVFRWAPILAMVEVAAFEPMMVDAVCGLLEDGDVWPTLSCVVLQLLPVAGHDEVGPERRRLSAVCRRRGVVIRQAQN